MKMLIVSALVCAMMVLTRAAAPPEETPEDETESTLVKRSTDCPHGWSLFGDHCYHYNPRRMTWVDAERNCQSLGGNLASVHNIQEYHAIQSVILHLTQMNDPAWIGGSATNGEAQWLWIDGTSFNYKYWCYGQPDGSGSCMQMNYSVNKCWDDTQCTRKLPSVCVMDSKWFQI